MRSYSELKEYLSQKFVEYKVPQNKPNSLYKCADSNYVDRFNNFIGSELPDNIASLYERRQNEGLKDKYEPLFVVQEIEIFINSRW